MQGGISRNDDISAFTPITAIRSALRYKGFPTEAHAPIPTVSRNYGDSSLIDEFHNGTIILETDDAYIPEKTKPDESGLV
jgi:hypothetical protein